KIMEVDLARRRVGLSLKALAADPWDGIAERYTVGKPIKGKVESVQDFGVFVTLEDGVTALLPASESNTDGQPMAVAFRLGMEIEAKVLRVDIDDKKMALTRREDAGRRDYGGGGGGGGGGGRGPSRDSRGGGRRDDRGPRRDGGGGGRSRPTLAYSDAPDKKAEKDDVGSLGALLLAAMKGKDKD
ncbi:MAG: small subunit ribosomal protein S1, partial [Myxococcota bacterium]